MAPAGLAIRQRGRPVYYRCRGWPGLKLASGIPVTVSAGPTSIGVAVNSPSVFVGQAVTLTAMVQRPWRLGAAELRRGFLL